MNDPHVETLHYTLVSLDPGVSFNAPPLEHRTPSFSVRLDDDHLTVTLLDHYADIESARADVDPYLEAWAIAATLGPGQRQVRFDYERGEVIDRRPPPPGAPRSIVSAVEMNVAVGLTVGGKEELVAGTYPAPPPDAFTVTEDVEALAQRWRLHREHRQPLPYLAYYALTAAEARSETQQQGRRRRPAREEASERLRVELAVLDKLGELSSERGDRLTARKYRQQHMPLTSAEEEWVSATVRRLIVRLGEVAALPDGEHEWLRMRDLPPLPASVATSDSD